MFSTKVLVIIAALAVAAGIPSLAGESKEVKTGREFAAEFEKNVKLITEGEIAERVSRIGGQIAAVARTVEVPAQYGSSEIADFSYEFKVVDEADINAFSIPGGITYVYKGLIDFTESDDELASVLAHEVAHAAHHHVMALMKKQSKMDLGVALVALLGGLSNMRGSDLTNVLYGAQFVRTARMTGYGQEAEGDADCTGVVYSMKAGYDPVASIRFLNKLERYQESRGEVRNLGIFQTHPRTPDRCKVIAAHLESMGVKFDLAEVAGLAMAEVVPAETDSGKVWKVVVADRPVCTTADAEGLTSQQRAEQTSAAINQLLRQQKNPSSLKMSMSGTKLIGQNKVIFSVTAADSTANGEHGTTILKDAEEAIRYAVWANWVKMQMWEARPGG